MISTGSKELFTAVVTIVGFTMSQYPVLYTSLTGEAGTVLIREVS